MIDNKKVGVGITTCNRVDFLHNLLNSLNVCREFVDEIVIVNDGTPINVPNIAHSSLLQNPTNLGIAKSKNIALKELKQKECEYYFLIEDDVIVIQPQVFEKYISASKDTGIEHFNFGPGSPFNRKQTIANFDLHNRHLLSETSEANPKAVIEYNTCKIALYQHITGMFSFYTNNVLDKVGLMDEKFFNAWEHVDHTQQIINAGYHPPFWWFADIFESDKYITTSESAIKNSSTSQKSKEWLDNVQKNAEVYKTKNGHYPNQTECFNLDAVASFLKKIKPSKTK